MAKVLLVEDDNNLREIYGARLTAEGYDIVSAPDGEEALAIAVKEKPDLIITDVMMPKISGFDMLDILRNAPETKNTKVIMMTALSQAEDKERADKLGADLYLVKSQVTLEDVVASVQKILGEPSAQAAPAPTPAPVAPAPSEPVVEKEVPAETPPAPPVPSVAPAAPVAPPAPIPDPQPTVQSAPVAQPSPAPVAPAPSEPVVPAPAAPSPASQPPAPVVSPAPEPKKIEVLLPEDKDQAPAAAPTEESAPVPPTEAASIAPDLEASVSVGPNLAEALAEEESTGPIQPTNGTQTPAVSSDNSPAVPSMIVKPQTPAPEEAQAANDAASAAPVSSNDNLNKKVIVPLNDPTKGPDLNSLLAQEESKAGQIPVTPAPEEQTPPADTAGPADHTDDFSKISL